MRKVKTFIKEVIHFLSLRISFIHWIRNYFQPKPLVACTLTAQALKQRKATIISRAKASVLKIKTIRNGYAFLFPGQEPVLDEIMHLVKAERKCCSFLTFDLKVKKESLPVELKITGPKGTKDFLKYELGLDQANPNNI